jgi:hypothetical protein
MRRWFPCFVPALLSLPNHRTSCLTDQRGDRFWSGRERKTLVILIDLLRVFLQTERVCSMWVDALCRELFAAINYWLTQRLLIGTLPYTLSH